MCPLRGSYFGALDFEKDLPGRPPSLARPALSTVSMLARSHTRTHARTHARHGTRAQMYVLARDTAFS